MLEPLIMICGIMAASGERDLVKEDKEASAQGAGVLSEADTEAIRPVVDSVNELGWDWLKDAVKEQPGENVCVSPLSLMTLSVALARGAEREVKDQLWGVAAKSLCREGSLPNSFSEDAYLDGISLLNKYLSSLTKGYLHCQTFYTNRAVRVYPDYARAVKGTLGMNVVPLPEKGGMEFINKNISRQTRGFISQYLTPSMWEDGQSWMLDVVGFASQWEMPFDADLTKKSKFYSEDKKTNIPCFFMKNILLTDYRQGNDYALISLDYANATVSFCIILPNEGITLSSLLKGSGAQVFKDYVALMNAPRKSESKDDRMAQVLYMPKFSMETPTQNLNAFFKKIGAKKAFESGVSPFLRISGQDLFLKEIYQKNFMTVNEQGSVSYGVAAANMPFGGGEKDLRVDRPFLFFIADRKTGTAMFAGVVYNPGKGQLTAPPERKE